VPWPSWAPFRSGEFELKTIDQQVAEVIGKGVRFRSVSASSSGDPRQSYSSLGGTNHLPSDPTPLSLYTPSADPHVRSPPIPKNCQPKRNGPPYVWACASEIVPE
jgi:hypothetical protein